MTWSAIRLLLILVVINGWCTRQVDFVLVDPQAEIETELYMEVPCDFRSPGKDRVLKVV